MWHILTAYVLHMLEFYAQYYKTPFLWHFLKFFLMTVGTKDKFPAAALKQLHPWLFF